MLFKPPTIFDPSKTIREQIWFHGSIPRQEAIRLLQTEGSFLLRESVNNPGELVLSAQADGQTRHFKMHQNEVVCYFLVFLAFEMTNDFYTASGKSPFKPKKWLFLQRLLCDTPY